jgi:hypothetical protein
LELSSELKRNPRLRLQIHAPEQVGKARVGAQLIEEWVNLMSFASLIAEFAMDANPKQAASSPR